MSSEAYFIDRDLFVKYVEEEVNPARVANGLEPVGDGVASHLYDVLESGRYRKSRKETTHEQNTDHPQS